eukprot:COSAG02_NODE_3697_length_6371_cov_40.094866_1_plen_63_part_00
MPSVSLEHCSKFCTDNCTLSSLPDHLSFFLVGIFSSHYPACRLEITVTLHEKTERKATCQCT